MTVPQLGPLASYAVGALAPRALEGGRRPDLCPLQQLAAALSKQGQMHLHKEEEEGFHTILMAVVSLAPCGICCRRCLEMSIHFAVADTCRIWLMMTYAMYYHDAANASGIASDAGENIIRGEA